MPMFILPKSLGALRLAGMTSSQCAAERLLIPRQTFTEPGPESGVPSVAITIARFG
jgi:hypothetical protein